jgi:hypothetical protein
MDVGGWICGPDLIRWIIFLPSNHGTPLFSGRRRLNRQRELRRLWPTGSSSLEQRGNMLRGTRCTARQQKMEQRRRASLPRGRWLWGSGGSSSQREAPSMFADPWWGRCSYAPPIKARVGEASGGSIGPSWLGGGARVAVIWCGTGGGLAWKMAVALVLQGGSPGWVFIGEVL